MIDEGDGLRVLLVGSRDVDSAAVTSSLIHAIERVGVHGVPVQVDLVDGIPRTALGKSPLVRRAVFVPAAH